MDLPLLNEYIDDHDPHSYIKRTTKGLKEARIRTLQHQKQSKTRFDLKHPEITFSEGDLVLVAHFQRVVGKVSKWLHNWTGPYKVVKRLGNINYALQDLKHKTKALKTVSVRHMKPYYDQNFESDFELSDGSSHISSDTSESLAA